MTRYTHTAGPAPSAPPLDTEPFAPPPPVHATVPVQEQLRRVLDKHEITIASAQDLVALEGYEIVFVIDDSGSMQLPSDPPSKRNLGVQSRTRWDELCETVKMVAELACVFDEDGIDMYFLNRPSLHHVGCADDPRLLNTLATPPAGSTPLTETIARVVADYSSSERPVLLLIATDGEPNGGPKRFMSYVHDVIMKKVTTRTFKFQILACTDDDDSVAWLDKFDRRYKEVDVTDDYYTERAQILRTGRKKFTRSDWVIKALLGPILVKFDDMDETHECNCSIM
eukprot:TRINITY_DN257_c0_g2_i4.p1 TRINITY_DN257_c0_g2~~TRINITY_DN257_c0_g2_i4.p1  ORF type:complete len:283 (+),score=80.92 TRINITY_DN257_c0_g2_i4:41-889(+)